jgi:hypothetical protein
VVEPAALGPLRGHAAAARCPFGRGRGGRGEQPLAPLETLDGFGRLGPPLPGAQPLAASRIAEEAASPRHPPGWYGSGIAGGEAAQRRALNLGAGIPPPRAAAPPPPSAALQGIGGVPAERDLGPWLLAVAMLLLVADLLASLWLRGAIGRPAAALARALPLLLLLGAGPTLAQAPGQAGGQDGNAALATRLAYVRTGDTEVDEVSRQGLVGLSDFVNRRTAAALADPLGVTPGATTCPSSRCSTGPCWATRRSLTRRWPPRSTPSCARAASSCSTRATRARARATRPARAARCAG